MRVSSRGSPAFPDRDRGTVRPRPRRALSKRKTLDNFWREHRDLAPGHVCSRQPPARNTIERRSRIKSERWRCDMHPDPNVYPAAHDRERIVDLGRRRIVEAERLDPATVRSAGARAPRWAGNPSPRGNAQKEIGRSDNHGWMAARRIASASLAAKAVAIRTPARRPWFRCGCDRAGKATAAGSRAAAPAG